MHVSANASHKVPASYSADERHNPLQAGLVTRPPSLQSITNDMLLHGPFSAKGSTPRRVASLPLLIQEIRFDRSALADTENLAEKIDPTAIEKLELRRIYTEAFQGVTWHQYDLSFIDMAFAKELANKQREWVIVRRGKSIAGFCTLELQPEKNSVYIAEMAVDPIFANQGVGKSLIEFSKKRLQEGGTVDLVARRLNLPAIALYEKMGFCVVNQLHAGYDASQYIGMTCDV